MVSSEKLEVQPSTDMAAKSIPYKVDPLAIYKVLWDEDSAGRAVLEVVNNGECFRILHLNSAIAQPGLFKDSESLGKTLQDSLSAPIVQTFQLNCNRCVRTRLPVSFELEPPASAGLLSNFDVEKGWAIALSPIKDEAGEVYQLLLKANSLRPPEKTEALLAADVQDARTIIDNAQEAIFIHDLDSGNVLDVNEQALNMFRISREEALIYRISHEYATPESPVHLLPELWKRALQGERVEIDWPSKRPSDGSRLDLEVTLQKVVLSGQPRIMACVRDVSDRKRMEAEQNRLLAILEATPDLVGIADAEGNSLYLNPAGQKLLGISAEMVASLHVSQAVAPRHREMFQSSIVPQMMEQGSWKGEIALVTSEGTEVPVSQVMIAHKDASGKLKRMSTVMRDMSVEKAAEEKLRDREQFLNSIYSGSELVIFAWDVFTNEGSDFQARCSGWNPACEAATGMAAKDVIGKSPFEVFGIEQGNELIQNFSQCASQRQSLSYEEKIEIEGRPTWWATKLNPIQDQTGQVYRVVGTTTNITEIKVKNLELEVYSQCQTQQAEALSAALLELKRTQTQIVQSEKMSSLGQMVAGVAHEINNPVNFIHANLSPAYTYATELLDLIELYQSEYPKPSAAIAATLDDLEFDFIKEDFMSLLASMKIGTQRIKEIVLSLRNFSRLDEAEMKAVNINTGIDSTLVILSHKLKANALEKPVEVSKNYQLSDLVECYPSQLNQVVMNIVANAIDALDQTNEPHIHIATKGCENFATIIISDNGPGMPEAVQARIFDPFYTTKAIGKGTGMGLSISYQIVTEKHGGTLSVSTRAEQGTQFAIQIPLSQRPR